jgi:RNA polymerase sigma factor (sigma-70 family)
MGQAYTDLKNYMERVYGKDSPVISIEEEYPLKVKAKHGDWDAWVSLISANMGLAFRFFKRYEFKVEESGLFFPDIVSEFFMKKHKRFIETYDPEKGKNSRFASYIYDVETTSVLNYSFRTALSGGIRGQNFNPVYFLPLPEEGRAESGSFEEGFSGESAVSYKEISFLQSSQETPSDLASGSLDYQGLSELIGGLEDEKYRKVLSGFYYEGKSFCKMGREMGFSGQYVRILHNEALKKLRFRVSKDVALEKRLG